MDMGSPTNINEVQPLIGRMAVLSRFISKSAEKDLQFFKILRKVKDFERTEEYRRAFEKLKAYLAKLPLLVKSIPGDTLYFRYRQRPRPSALCWYEKKMWAIELSEYDISYLPRTTVKAQALADFVSEITGTTQEEVPEERPWLLHVDGSSTAQGSGAGVVITSPQGEGMEFAIKFDFKASNNEAEYEALVIGMRMAQDIGVLHLLACSDSQLIVKQVSGVYEVKEDNMVQYLLQIEELKIKFKSFQLQ
ncbi:UNVERIFIED_CONTAM: hypothetical protein Sradi_4116200 [Sesamum radiatum]|uniref:RNase H type-1 domain-containing protein n=1 Tax=Sesamum radiatum TaxID=300843 RepID=A0AAW2P168_SESRA